MRLAVDQIRQRLHTQPPDRKIGQAPVGIWNAARAAPRIAGASLGKAPARVTPVKQKRDQGQIVDVLRFGSQKTAAKADR
jgi:hypothetical protein